MGNTNPPAKNDTGMPPAPPLTPRSGLWLRGWREQRHMTQQVLAEMLGVNVRTVVRWEQMDELPRLVVLALENQRLPLEG